MQTPDALIFGGIAFDGRDAEHPLIKLRTGCTEVVRVKELPVHLLIARRDGYLDLRDVGREAELLKLVVEHFVTAEKRWEKVSPVVIDLLSEESHVMLVEAADRLNFHRAVSHAERQIATGKALHCLKQKMA